MMITTRNWRQATKAWASEGEKLVQVPEQATQET